MMSLLKRILSAIMAGIVGLTSFIAGVFTQKDLTLENGYNTENLCLYTVPEWYRDAKFGIFVHYGVYSVPAYGDEWYGNNMYIPGSHTYGGDDIYTHHIETYGGAENFGYKDFIPEFNENLKSFKENNMAEQWAEIFSRAGAKYVMPVGIHHDSFALYASDIQTTYNSVAQADFDYIGAIKEALADKDIKLGISNHFAENDWFFNDEYAEGTDLALKNEDGSLVFGELYGDGKSKSSEHVHKWFDISMEIIEKYNPDIIYYDFDLGSDAFDTYSDANRYLMLANYYNHGLENNPDGVVCCNKHYAFTQAQAVLDKERSALADIASTPWQTDTSLGKKSWGYITNEEYRSGEQFIGALVDIVSKNGNLLLNVGPKADGTIPEEEAEALKVIGDWLAKYGDAIYCTRPWIVSGEGPTVATDDSFTYAEGDIRFTKAKTDDILYITSLTGVSGDTFTVKTLKQGEWAVDTVKEISLINGSDRIPLAWRQTEKGLEMNVPEACKDEPFSIEVTFADRKIPPVATGAEKTIVPELAYETSGIKHGYSAVDGSVTMLAEEDGAYAKYALTFEDFKTGGMRINVTGKSKGIVTVYNDDTNDCLAQIKVKASRSDYRTLTQELLSEIPEEKINLRLELSQGIELCGFGFCEQRKYNTVIDASRFDEKHGSVQAEPTADPEGGGNSLGYVAAGDYVVYKNVDFGDGCDKLYLRAGADSKNYKVYIDKKSATKVIAKGKIETGSYDNYETLEVAIKKVSGKHDVYIEFVNDSVNLNWFCFCPPHVQFQQ